MNASHILAARAPWTRAQLATFLLLASLVLLSACAPRNSLFSDAQPAGPPAPQISVLQGDVLTINGETVRLVDAVTPLPSPDARCAAEALGAHQAEHRLRDLTHGVRIATVTLTGARDDQNRPYAHVLLDGEDLAHDLIEDGLAVAAGGKPFDWCAPLSTSLPRAAHIANLSFSGT